MRPGGDGRRPAVGQFRRAQASDAARRPTGPASAVTSLPGDRTSGPTPLTATDFNGHRGTQTVTEGTDAIVTLATEPPTREPAGTSTASGLSPGEARARS